MLVVDDDEAFVVAVSRWLADLGFQATAVGTVGAAIDALGEGLDYAFILLDLDLPDVSGLSLLRRLNREDATTPVIVASATDDVQDVIRVWREHASDYLRKPFNIDDLNAAIERTIVAPVEDHQALHDEADDTLDSSSAASSSEDSPAEPRSETLAAPKSERIRPIVARLREAISAGRLSIPVIDPEADNLQQFLARTDFTMQEVAAAIGRDAGLTLGVLRSANSAQYARGGNVTSVLEACSRLGAVRVVALALEVAVRQHFTLSDEPFRSVMTNLWRNSAASARLAEGLARALKQPDVDAYYVEGLLHNLGEIICVKLYAEMSEAGERIPPLDRVCTEVAKIHEQVGAVVAACWRLPEGLAGIVGHHHRAAQPSEPFESRRRRLIILSAWSLAVEYGFGYWPFHHGCDSERYLKALGVEPNVVETLTAQIHLWGI